MTVPKEPGQYIPPVSVPGSPLSYYYYQRKRIIDARRRYVPRRTNSPKAKMNWGRPVEGRYGLRVNHAQAMRETLPVAEFLVDMVPSTHFSKPVKSFLRKELNRLERQEQQSRTPRSSNPRDLYIAQQRARFNRMYKNVRPGSHGAKWFASQVAADKRSYVEQHWEPKVSWRRSNAYRGRGYGSSNYRRSRRRYRRYPSGRRSRSAQWYRRRGV